MQQAEGLFQFDFNLPIYENLIVSLVNVWHFLRSTSNQARIKQFLSGGGGRKFNMLKSFQGAKKKYMIKAGMWKRSGGSGHVLMEAEARKVCRFHIIQKSIL